MKQKQPGFGNLVDNRYGERRYVELGGSMGAVKMADRVDEKCLGHKCFLLCRQCDKMMWQR